MSIRVRQNGYVSRAELVINAMQRDDEPALEDDVEKDYAPCARLERMSQLFALWRLECPGTGELCAYEKCAGKMQRCERFP
jgi:hypothetical protein